MILVMKVKAWVKNFADYWKNTKTQLKYSALHSTLSVAIIISKEKQHRSALNMHNCHCQQSC